MELYKLMIYRGGIIIIVVFFIYYPTLPNSVIENPGLVDKYMEEYSGVITENTLEKVMNERNDLINGTELYQNTVSNLMDEKISSVDYLELVGDHAMDNIKLDAINEFIEIIHAANTRSEELGTQLSIINEVPFRSVYGEKALGARMLKTIFIMLILSLLFSYSITTEQTTIGIKNVIRSTKNGRGVLLKRKYYLASFCVFIIWLFSTLLETSTYINIGGVFFSDVQVQSLTALSEFPVKMTISEFFLSLYIVRLISMLSFSFIIIYVTSYIKHTQLAYVIICSIFVIPGVLLIYMKIDFMKFFTSVKLIDGIGIIVSENGDIYFAVIGLIIMTIASIICTIINLKRWIVSR